MPISVSRVTLWRRELANEAGALAGVLEPLVQAGANFQVAMGYRFPGDHTRAAVELAPVKGRKEEAAARAAGLTPSDIPTLVVVGDDRPGVGQAISRELARAGISMAFLVAQIVGRKYTMVVGFGSEADAKAAVPIIRRASSARQAKAGRSRTRR